MKNKLINLYLIFIIGIIPLIITPTGQDIFNDLKIFASVMATIIMFIVCILQKKDNKLDIVDILVLIFGILLILSTIFSEDLNLSVWGLPRCREGIISLITYLLIFFIFYKNYSYSEKTLDVIFIIASVISIYGMLQFFKIDPLLNVPNNEFRGIVTSTIGQRNFVGTYCTLLLPVSLGIFIKKGYRRYFLYSALIFGLMIASTTRSSWIAFIFYAAVLMIYSIRRKLYTIRLSLFAATLLIIFCGINYGTDNAIMERVYTVFTDAGNVHSDTSGSTRIYIWKKTFPMILDKPLLGSGPDTFKLEFTKGPVKYEPLYYKAHNEYLQIALTEGLIALAVYLTLVIIILYRLIKNYNNGIQFWILFCSINGYLIQAFFNISFISTAVIYWAMLGICAKCTKKYPIKSV